MRPEITVFAKLMDDVMSEKNLSYGDMWKKESPDVLENWLREELDEFGSFFGGKKRKQLVDMAIICMMLYYRMKVEDEPE